MIKILIFVMFFIYSLTASASRCRAQVQIENKTNEDKIVNVCLESRIDKLDQYKYPDEHILKAHDKKNISLVFMCGYPGDLPIEKYWVLFATGEGYQKIKYEKGNVILIE